jgi:hypothetical protein
VNIIASDKQTVDFLNSIRHFFGSRALHIIELSERPSYNDIFLLTKDFTDSVNIISNTDIVFDDVFIESIENFGIKPNDILALSRWDYVNSELNEIRHHDRADSQDCWIKYGAFPYMTDADFTMGVAGCDNRIAAIMFESGFNVLNPSKSVQTYHLHLTHKRNYSASNMVKGKYLLLTPF